MKNVAKKAVNVIIPADNALQAYYEARDSYQDDIVNAMEKIALDRQWNDTQAKIAAKNKLVFGQTINGKKPVRSSSKYSRWDNYRIANKSLPLIECLGKMFTQSDYASGAAASVIRAMGFNLLGNGNKAMECFDAQANYKRGKSMVTWAKNELKCIGIVERADIVNIMVNGLTDK